MGTQISRLQKKFINLPLFSPHTEIKYEETEYKFLTRSIIFKFARNVFSKLRQQFIANQFNMF